MNMFFILQNDDLTHKIKNIMSEDNYEISQF